MQSDERDRGGLDGGRPSGEGGSTMCRRDDADRVARVDAASSPRRLAPGWRRWTPRIRASARMLPLLLLILVSVVMLTACLGIGVQRGPFPTTSSLLQPGFHSETPVPKATRSPGSGQ